MFYLVLFMGHTASYQPHRACVRRLVTTCCVSQYLRPFTATPALLCTQKLEAPYTAKTLENFTPITLDRSKKKPKMQTTATLKRHFAPVDITGYEYDADTDLLFKSEVTGFEDEHGNTIDLQDETDEEKHRIIEQLHPQDRPEEPKKHKEEGFLQANVRPSVPEYFQEIFNHQDHAPYHAVGLLRMSYSKHGHIKGNFRYIGSAFLIDEDILMTAGHNLLPSEFKVPFKNGAPIVIKNTQRQEPDVMKFYRFCIKGQGEIAQVSKRQAHPHWHKNFRAGYDIGVLSLDHEFGAHQKLAIGKLPQPISLDQDIKVLGYPAHVQRTKASTPEPNYPLSMFASYGKVVAGIDSKDPTKVYYNCLTYGGNSGGAVVLRKNGQQKDQTVDFCSVAVHTNGHSLSNSGVQFTKEVEDFIVDAVRQFDETQTANPTLKKEQVKKVLADNQHMLSDQTYQFLQTHMDELVEGIDTEVAKDTGQLLAYLFDFCRSRRP